MRARSVAVGLVLALSVAGCQEFGELISFGDAKERAAAQAQAESAQLWEMTLMAGRYGVMLGQAREILNLPEPQRSPGDSFPTNTQDPVKQREALARYQADVTTEFERDVGAACKRKRVPANVRKVACAQKVPEDLRQAVKPDIQALSTRNDRVGEVIMPWWDAVCATAPKPREGDVPACAME